MIRTVTPTFSIIIALLVFFFFSKPMFQEIEMLQAETVKFEAAVERASELNTELSDKLTDKRSYPTEVLERLDALVPAEIDTVKILNDLNEMARTHNLLFGNVEVKEGEVVEKDDTEVPPVMSATYDDLTTTDIDFSLIGTYDQFKAFLSDVELSLLLLEVTHIEFISEGGDLHQYDVSVRAFSLPPIE